MINKGLQMTLALAAAQAVGGHMGARMGRGLYGK